jgi:hypothetical protein
MPPIKPVELKRALVREGFEIYRTAGPFVLLADRVRDNLIMDSGVALGLPAESASDGSAGNGSATAQQGGEHDWEQQGLVVRVVLKAQASEFPNEEGEGLLAHARALAGPFEGRGYRETSTQTVVVKDPGDGTRVLDTWYEVSLELPVEGLSAAAAELRFALEQKKTAGTPADD